MYFLRLTQNTEGEDKYRVEIALEGDGFPRQTVSADFEFKLTPTDQEELRWYLEESLPTPHDPAHKIAARVEKRMAEIGVELFKSLFKSDDARDMWATIRNHLNDTRIEIVTKVREATTIPWELVCDPKTDTPLALHAHAFVRAHPQPAQVPKIPQTGSGPIRILLAICRPKGNEDVPFRSVASRLIKGLTAEARTRFELDVLRPPTFEQLAWVLRTAKNAGQPYHVFHFDGHGTYIDARNQEGIAALMVGLTSDILSAPRSGAHGYLLFENPVLKDNMQLVDGTMLGKLLVETDVPVLVLNACRSAYAEHQTAPVSSEVKDSDDPHVRVRALGSLAQEVMEAGVAGVVAMRFNVYVVTAAQFMADLYSSLTQGNSLGEAVTLGRKQLAANSFREIAYKPIPLQDWLVPVVYESMPISLFPISSKPETQAFILTEGQAASGESGVDPDLPKPPDAGFFGRDETLLALDRAFDSQNIVLLHAFAGSGKTATAAEFARWYKLTGGIQGPVMFTSFEQYKPLNRVLDQIGQVFEKILERSGIQWLALEENDRRSIALHVLKQFPVLWIWDNIEPVSGFPEGADSAWNKTEQQELVDFLRDAKYTKVRFLLTSRRDEMKWLGNLPARIKMPPMPMQERLQLARALADKNGRRLTEVEDWLSLLQFTQGNPLTITVLVGQVLREGIETRKEMESFVSKLRAGEAVFDDEDREGRSSSLGASLNYGFSQAFSESERKQLSLLHFFEGFVLVDALKLMGSPEYEWCLAEVRGLTREAGIALLDRAAEIGLLTSLGGGGYYTIHPALPWFFRKLFRQCYSSEDMKAERAFVESMSKLGSYYAKQYATGNNGVIAALRVEESNLLHARHLARKHGWWKCVMGTTLGLEFLYDYMGRKSERSRLVEEIVPEFVDARTGGPLSGLEEEWGVVTQYRVDFAIEARQCREAEQLQRILVDWNRKEAAPFLALLPDKLDDVQRNKIRTLVVSLNELARIQSGLGQSECISKYEESLKLEELIGDRALIATTTMNIGIAYKNIPAIRNLAKAEQWLKRSLMLRDEHDKLGRAKCLQHMGFLAYERFDDAMKAKNPEEELLKYLNAALQFYQQALDMLPQDAVSSLSVTHNMLGVIYMLVGDKERAVKHYRDAIRYNELQGNLYQAGMTRYNVAFALVVAGRFDDALEYASAASRNFETCGDRAADWIKNTRYLIAKIEQLRKEGRNT